MYAIKYRVVTEDKTTSIGQKGGWSSRGGEIIKKMVINFRVREVRVGVSVWNRVIVIVDPLQSNTLLHTMALQLQ